MRVRLLTLSVAFLALALPATSSAAPVAGLCPNGSVQVRKPLFSLSGTEWNAFVAATKTLMAKSAAASAVSEYDTLANIFRTSSNAVLTYARYFPWHRRYLREFELALQRIDPRVTLPYWDFSVDGGAPALSQAFSASYFGGNGQGVKHAVIDGRFANWRPRYPSTHTLRRQFDRGNAITSWPTTEQVSAIVVGSMTYDSLRWAVESVAGAVHVGIGGDMAASKSANDPLFWVAQASVDRIWDQWQRVTVANERSYGGSNRNGTTAKLTNVLSPWTQTVGQVMYTGDLCYSYSE